MRQVAQHGQQQMAGTPDLVEETAGPHHARSRNSTALARWAWSPWEIGKKPSENRRCSTAEHHEPRY